MRAMRVLIIDDDQNMCHVLRRGLEAESYSVDTAFGGKNGLYLATITDYDLIILDNAMPDEDGRSVCRKIRAGGKTTPVLILSALSSPTEKIDLLNIGADDYLGKPFSFGELLARMRALMRRPRAVVEETICVGPLSLNTRTHTVRRDEEDISLTRKEYMLLKYFMLNKSAVLSRAMLMEHVWDMHLDPFSNTVEAHIASLRKKIEDPHQTRLIHTVAGRGYKLECV